MNEHQPDQIEVIEAKLVLAAQQDKREFEALYLYYVKPIYRYLYSRLGDRPEAEDATAQTFLNALEGIDRYREDGHFAAWLFAIARRKAADYFRQSKRSTFLSDDLPGLEEDLLQQADQRERRKLLQTLVTELSEEDQELLRLRFAAGLAFAEIARLFVRNEDAIKKSVYRLLENLQNRMEGNNE